MIVETTYTAPDLKKDTCTSCGEKSDEILISDGRCVDCIQADLFYEMTMSGEIEGDLPMWP